MTYHQLYKWIDDEVEKYRLVLSKAQKRYQEDAAEMMLEFLEDFKLELKIKETQDECKSNYNQSQQPACIS